jgi:hypothetical protein
MTTEQFATWLQGYFELSDAKTLNEKQVKIVKDHLALVFEKVTPDRSIEEEGEDELNKIKFEPKTTSIPSSKKRYPQYGPGNRNGSNGSLLVC